MRATVLGAGVAGLAAALDARRARREVTLIERVARARRQRLVVRRRHAGAVLRGRKRAGRRRRTRAAGAIDWWAARVPGVVRAMARWSSRRRAMSSEIERFARAHAAHERVDEARDRGARARSCRALPQGPVLRRAKAISTRARRCARSPRRLARDAAPEIRFGDDGAHSRLGDGVVVDCRGLAARDELDDLARRARRNDARAHAAKCALSRPVRFLHPRIPLYIVAARRTACS